MFCFTFRFSISKSRKQLVSRYHLHTCLNPKMKNPCIQFVPKFLQTENMQNRNSQHNMKSPTRIKNFLVFRYENIRPQYVSASGSDTIGEFGDDSDYVLKQNKFNSHLATKQESKHCDTDDFLGNERRGFHERDWIHRKSWRGCRGNC